MFLHRNIHKYTCTFPKGKTHKQNDHILTDRRCYSNILDVRPFREANCDTDHYLVVAKVWERFNLRKLNDLQVRKQYQIQISNRFAALENLSDSEDINRASESSYFYRLQENLCFS
jgi:hypothetical protein